MKFFLKTFKEFGEENGFFKEEITGTFKGSIDEQFSSCTFLGINGDDFKDKNYKKYYTGKPKSCDVIKFLDEKIDFIEFKRLKIEEVRNINDKINEYDLTKKLKGSYDLLKNIINENDFIYNNKNKLIIDIEKKFIISIFLLGCDSKNILGISGKIGIIKRNLRGYFKQNPVPFGENFLEPIFIQTKKLNKEYSN